MSKIINFSEHHNEKLEKKFTNDVLDLIELPDYRVDTLKIILRSVSNIMHFSGDIEGDESREVTSCDPAQLVRAAGNQLFTLSAKGEIIRLTFDGDYFYDLYFYGYVTQELRECMINTLTMECDINSLLSVKNQHAFNDGLNNLLTE